jgi:hypothetical protein
MSDICYVEPFRPPNHPLGNVFCCKKCKKATVSLPAYPTDYFDCHSCGHSWEPTKQQIKKMKRGVNINKKQF